MAQGHGFERPTAQPCQSEGLCEPAGRFGGAKGMLGDASQWSRMKANERLSWWGFELWSGHSKRMERYLGPNHPWCAARNHTRTKRDINLKYRHFLHNAEKRTKRKCSYPYHKSFSPRLSSLLLTLSHACSGRQRTVNFTAL